MLRYLPRIFKKTGLPVHVVYHCTYRCDSRCKSCFLWEEIGNKDIDKELSLDEIRKVRGALKGILWLQIGGGEPFLREDLPEICDVFGDVDTMAIPTNCLQPERIEAKTKEILRYVKTRLFLMLSLDGIGETHDAIRGAKGNFTKVLETYRRLDSLRTRYTNFKLGINTVIMKENQAEISGVIDYVKRSFSVDMHAFEFLRGRPRSESFSVPGITERERLMPMIKGCISSYGYAGGWKGRVLKKVKLYQQDLIKDTLQRDKKQIDCFAGRLSAVMDPYGNIYACELIDDKIGNVRDVAYDFSRLWSSPKAWEIRRKIRGCYCTHSCFYLINSIFNSRVLAKAILRRDAPKNLRLPCEDYKCSS